MANNNISGFNIGNEVKKIDYNELANKPAIPAIPESLKNPNAITFTGAVTGAYDGSKAVTINIPDGSDTTYNFAISGNKLTITPSSGDPQEVTLPTPKDNNTTYTFAVEGNTLTITPSDGGEATTITLPGEQVQADWNENDETSKAFVKNRPFYTEAPAKHTLFNKTLTMLRDGDIFSAEDSDFTVASMEYTVEINGNSYTANGGTDGSIGDKTFPTNLPFFYDGSKWAITRSIAPTKTNVEEKLLSEKSVGSVLGSEGSGKWGMSHTDAITTSGFHLSDYIGKELTVYYNGKESKVLVKKGSDTSLGTSYSAAIGNISLETGSTNAIDVTNDEFFLGEYSDGYYFMKSSVDPTDLKLKITDKKESASVPIIVSSEYGEVHKIDPQYENSPDWNENDSQKSTFIKNRPFYEPDLVTKQLGSVSSTLEYRTGNENVLASHSIPESPSFDGLNTTDTYIVENGGQQVEGKLTKVNDWSLKFNSFNDASIDELNQVQITFTLQGNIYKITDIYAKCTVAEYKANSKTVSLAFYKKISETKKIDKRFLPDFLEQSDLPEGAYIGEKGGGNNAEIFNDPSNRASGESSHAEGLSTFAIGKYSHAEGYHTSAQGMCQHTFGQYNLEDSTETNKYVETVGNGSSSTTESNARTLDWDGNEWLAGSIEPNNGLVLKSTTEGSSKRFRITVDDTGALKATQIASV